MTLSEYIVIMLTTYRPLKKPSPWLLFSLTLVLTLYLSFTGVYAQQLPKLQQWHINGTLAALDDEHDTLKGYALGVFSFYEPNNFCLKNLY